MPVCAVATTPLPMRRCPATPTCPASTTSSSIDGAAGDADLRREQHALADGDAVRNLHEVVDLGAGADARLADRRPIDRGVGADLDVVFDDDVGVLRNLQVRAVRLLDEAEPVAADDRAVLHDDAMADPARARESRRARG